MKRVVSLIPLLIAALLALASAEAGSEPAVGAGRPAELEECLAALQSPKAAERLRAVRELSGWALEVDYRTQALGSLALARFDAEIEVALQAELALATLTGGDPDAVRAAYGIVPPNRRTLAERVVSAESPRVRYRALVALGRWHPGSEIETLLSATRDPAAAIRLQALELLLELPAEEARDRQVAEALARARVDPDPAIRRLAQR